MTSQPARRLHDDRGFMIIEVLVSALILIMVSLAVFSTLDNADRAAGNQQKRAMAANFVQSELERIRSLPVEDIAAMRGTRTVVRDDLEYYVTTTAKWVSDGDDEAQCSTRNGGLDYMRTTVSITWKNMGQSKPVSFTSLFTPTAGAGGDTGSLSVRLLNRNSGPVPNVPITLDGPSTFTETTNKNGCVIFAFVPESLDYELRFSRAGFVNEQSENLVKENVTVTARETTKLQYLYDSGGYTNVKPEFAALKANVAYPDYDDLAPVSPDTFQMYHAEQRAPGISVDVPNGQTSWDGAGRPWFPFLTPYALYAGNCAKNVPPAGLSFGNLSYSTLVNITPLATQSAGRVIMPALKAEVYLGTSAVPGGRLTSANGAKVEISADCNVNWQKELDGTGELKDRGVPYTTAMRICASGNVPGYGNREVMWRTTFPANKAWNVAPTLYLREPTSSPTMLSRAANATPSCFD